MSESGSLLYCVGTAKSGTQSIGFMFDDSIRSAHEPEHAELIRMIIDHAAGKVSRENLVAWIKERDRRLKLDVDSSFLNYHILDVLLEEFEKSRFLLTIRDCYSWLNSQVNHIVKFAGEVVPTWGEIRDYRFGGQEFTYAAGDQAFKKKGLRPLEAYLSHWATHNRDVLKKVPAERLLVVRTDQISGRSQEIAAFAGIPVRAIQTRKTHAHHNETKVNLVGELDRDYLEQLVKKHCQPLMTQYFPEIKSLDDARV
jgi:hypothetical protein